ncbi:MAG: hypothetical protein AB1Z98_39030, partial [Nannocystaceae bacterium]
CGGLLLAAGCVTHRGPWTTGSPPEVAAPDPASGSASEVELVLLANLSPDDRGARAVAARVDEYLADDRPRVVLWLGNVAAAPLRSALPVTVRRGPRCLPADQAWSTGAAARLAEATGPLDAAGRSFATMGLLDHRCGHRDQLSRNDGNPWAVPGDHYWLRIYGDGSVEVRLSCGDGSCRQDGRATGSRSTSALPLADLIVVDLLPWLSPREEPSARREDERRVDELRVLLSAVAELPPETSPPRLLVSSVPVEAAGEHGLGTLWPDATFHVMPPPLQRLLLDGGFAGVLSAHDRSLSATPDLFDAIKRADRAWLRSPLFQVQAGAVARPNRRAAMALRRPRVRHSNAYRAPVLSDHAGFAVVRLRPDDATLELHAHRGGRWQTSSLDVPLRPAPHPERTASPHMGPCRDCPPIPANER